MKTNILVAILALFLLAGCGKPPETPMAQIKSYPTITLTGKFDKFGKLPIVTSEPDPDGVRFEGIGFGAEGAYVMVQFRAPMSQSQLWHQDYIYVVDEKTLCVYKDIPVMPVVGPLIGRPSQEGQLGYVMLVNYQGGIKAGSVVSIVLGNYRRQHIIVP